MDIRCRRPSLRHALLALALPILAFAAPRAASATAPAGDAGMPSAPEVRGPGRMVLGNVLGPLLSLAGSALASPIGLGDGVFLLNARHHRAQTANFAWTITPTVAWVSLGYDTWTIGCKGGPRFSGGARWLEGWYVHPFAALAWIHVRPLREGVPGAAPGADGISLGLGVEGGYTWAFSSGFALELGLGLGQTAAIPFGEGETISGLRPVFNIGLGYAW